MGTRRARTGSPEEAARTRRNWMKRLIALVAAQTLTALWLATLATAPAQASSTTATCEGQPATIVGTQGGDTIDGTSAGDVIVGLGGDDVIRGLGGDDLVCGGRGDDVLYGGPGADGLDGGAGNDLLRCGPGHDGGATGGTGNDQLFGEKDGPNDLYPGPGDDLVVGSASGPDYLHFEDATGPISANLLTGIATGQGTDRLVNVDSLFSGDFDDTLIGDNRGNALVGRAGNDTLVGHGGNDSLSGQQGDDLYEGGPGFDLAEYYDQNHADGLSYGPMNVNLQTGIATGDGTDTLRSIWAATGSDGPDTMIGNSQANFFFLLLGGRDNVDARGGNDFVYAGAGADQLIGGPGRDLVGFFDFKNQDKPRPLGVTVNLSAGTDSDGDSLRGFENIDGSFHDDTLIGNSARNKVFGDPGNDVLVGRGGADRLLGGSDRDTANGGTGTDWCAAEIQHSCELPPDSAGADRSWTAAFTWIPTMEPSAPTPSKLSRHRESPTRGVRP
jgi:Ca2+-binding RTX toxin-like protein